MVPQKQAERRFDFDKFLRKATKGLLEHYEAVLRSKGLIAPRGSLAVSVEASVIGMELG